MIPPECIECYCGCGNAQTECGGPPDVIVGCEESGKVRDAFTKIGIKSCSCDIKPSRAKGLHHQGDIVRFLQRFPDKSIGILILHPDCTEMAVSGNRHYAKGTPGYEKRQKAIEWTLALWDLALKKAKRVCLENPVSTIFPYLRKRGANVQYIQPHQFGHGETKNTGLALYNLPELEPTDEVEGREQRIWKMPPGPNRKRDRSETFDGISEAMADQWGIFL
jgi:hypothetical protein